jgi:hypothetical protein
MAQLALHASIAPLILSVPFSGTFGFVLIPRLLNRGAPSPLCGAINRSSEFFIGHGLYSWLENIGRSICDTIRLNWQERLVRGYHQDFIARRDRSNETVLPQLYCAPN